MIFSRGTDSAPAASFRVAGWNPDHATWYYLLELPARADGTRRPPPRAGGFATRTAAETDLGAARDLLAIAAPGDQETARRIASAITASLRKIRRLPDPAGSARRSGPGATRR